MTEPDPKAFGIDYSTDLQFIKKSGLLFTVQFKNNTSSVVK